MNTARILLINPWIYDFAAYDFWAKPMGLLYLGAILREHGFTISYLDCLEHRPVAPATLHARQGRRPYLKTIVSKPAGLADVPRHYARYGMSPEKFEHLLRLQAPDVVLLTCLMTYWYPGVQAAVAILRRLFPGVPLVLGGIYATLCREHALKTIDVDEIISGPAESRILEIVARYTGVDGSGRSNPSNYHTLTGSAGVSENYPYPAWDLQTELNYLPMLTTRGCPLGCRYCASSFLTPEFSRRDPKAVLAEISFWQAHLGITDLVFYDDALLLQAEMHARPLLEGLAAEGGKLALHTPNALHIAAITPELACLMYRAGFKTIRLGLETTEFEKRRKLDNKVTAAQFESAVNSLHAAGFTKDQVGAYILVGLPEQSEAAIMASFESVRAAGITPVPAYYSPIPHTALWPEAVKNARYDLEADPLYTNNAVLPCRAEGFSWSLLTRLKELAR